MSLAINVSLETHPANLPTDAKTLGKENELLRQQQTAKDIANFHSKKLSGVEEKPQPRLVSIVDVDWLFPKGSPAEADSEAALVGSFVDVVWQASCLKPANKFNAGVKVQQPDFLQAVGDLGEVDKQLGIVLKDIFDSKLLMQIDFANPPSVETLLPFVKMATAKLEVTRSQIINSSAARKYNHLLTDATLDFINSVSSQPQSSVVPSLK